MTTFMVINGDLSVGNVRGTILDSNDSHEMSFCNFESPILKNCRTLMGFSSFMMFFDDRVGL